MKKKKMKEDRHAHHEEMPYHTIFMVCTVLYRSVQYRQYGEVSDAIKESNWTYLRRHGMKIMAVGAILQTLTNNKHSANKYPTNSTWMHYCIAVYSLVQYMTEQHSTVLYITTHTSQHSAVRCISVPFGALEYSTVLYCQYSVPGHEEGVVVRPAGEGEAREPQLVGRLLDGPHHAGAAQRGGSAFTTSNLAHREQYSRVLYCWTRRQSFVRGLWPCTPPRTWHTGNSTVEYCTVGHAGSLLL